MPADVSDPHPLERYRPLVDDWEAFVDANAKPLPRVVWANPLRASADDLARVREEVVAAGGTPLGWRADAWRLPDAARPGSWLSYKMGWLHSQEEAALWAVDAMDLSSGLRVLDMCASPGNKTAQIALAMSDNGAIVANERATKRLGGLRYNLDRLGVTCATVRAGDGVRMQGEALYDRVLVDAPCTCEGTSRKSGRGAAPERFRHSISQIQVALLRKAVRLVRPGGVVVYATCTYAPEENERVLHAVRDEVAIEPITLPDGLVAASGVTEWEGQTFRDDVRNAARLWPHTNDTGGFFVAKVRRV